MREYAPMLSAALDEALPLLLPHGETRFDDLEHFTLPLTTRINARCIVGAEQYSNPALIRAFIDLDHHIEETVRRSLVPLLLLLLLLILRLLRLLLLLLLLLLVVGGVDG